MKPWAQWLMVILLLTLMGPKFLLLCSAAIRKYWNHIGGIEYSIVWLPFLIFHESEELTALTKSTQIPDRLVRASTQGCFIWICNISQSTELLHQFKLEWPFALHFRMRSLREKSLWRIRWEQHYRQDIVKCWELPVRYIVSSVPNEVKESWRLSPTGSGP